MVKWRTQKWEQRTWRFPGLLQVSILLAGSITFVAAVCLLMNRDYLDSPQHDRVHGAGKSLLQSMEDEGSGSEKTEVDNAFKSAPLFPPEIFTVEQLRHGVILFHVLGMVYMFVALVIVCDKFFVPSIDVIVEKANISADVASAIVMAAGVSAPKLFSSVVGVFISFNFIGIGTIVGSAVFNILFVIAMCVIFSKTVLHLTWWTIFRDYIFYSIALIVLVLFFLDTKIYWYEAIVLFCVYICYCVFMLKMNHPFERLIKRHLNKNKVTRDCPTNQLVSNNLGPVAGHRDFASSASPVSRPAGFEDLDEMHGYRESTKMEMPQYNKLRLSEHTGVTTDADDDNNEEIKPIDLSWPDTCWKRITYPLVMPLIIPMWLTMPDVRTPRGKRFFPIAFFGSIIWISLFNYLMVWWTTTVGHTFSITPEIMGLTILAAGASIPVAMMSVSVARKGFGDMAISFAIGINIFDVCVGLPVPLMLFSLVEVIKNVTNGQSFAVDPITVGANGMACSIVLLFAMMMLVLISILCSKWKMKKGLGISMFFFYLVFVAISVTFEYDIVKCFI